MNRKILIFLIFNIIFNVILSQDNLCYLSEKDSALIIEKYNTTKKIRIINNKFIYKNCVIEKAILWDSLNILLNNHLNKNIDKSKMPELNVSYIIGIIISKKGEVIFEGLYKSVSKIADYQILKNVRNFKINQKEMKGKNLYIIIPFNYELAE